MGDSGVQFLKWFDTANFFFHSDTFQFVGGFLVFYIAILWLALVIWVTRDAMYRSSSILFQIGAILLNIFLPVFGLILYLIIRPHRTLLEKYHEDLEYRMLEGGESYCFSCAQTLREGFQFCLKCAEEVNHACEQCKKQFPKKWDICPYCGEKKGKTDASLKKKKED
ncbi:zinc ribbon domain-containing protein [Candidatus Peregrinibacteria bacterium]|nr:zinc ribbon domain-containing protein [Candidatus Peregrinibacteria bacterium]